MEKPPCHLEETHPVIKKELGKCFCIKTAVVFSFKTELGLGLRLLKKHKSFIQINNNEIKKEEFKLHQTTSGVVSCHPALLYPTEMICSNSMTESWLTHTTNKNQTLCGRVCVWLWFWCVFYWYTGFYLQEMFHVCNIHMSSITVDLEDAKRPKVPAGPCPGRSWSTEAFFFQTVVEVISLNMWFNSSHVTHL